MRHNLGHTTSGVPPIQLSTPKQVTSGHYVNIAHSGQQIEASSVEMSSWGFPFSCGVCQEKFEKKAELTDHIKYSHPDQK